MGWGVGEDGETHRKDNDDRGLDARQRWRWWLSSDSHVHGLEHGVKQNDRIRAATPASLSGAGSRVCAVFNPWTGNTEKWGRPATHLSNHVLIYKAETTKIIVARPSNDHEWP